MEVQHNYRRPIWKEEYLVRLEEVLLFWLDPLISWGDSSKFDVDDVRYYHYFESYCSQNQFSSIQK